MIDTSTAKQVAEQVSIRAPTASRTKDNNHLPSQLNLVGIAPQSQEELTMPSGSRLESRQSPLSRPTTTKEKKHTSDHELEGEYKMDEWSVGDEPSVGGTTSFSASPTPAKRRRQRLHSHLLDHPSREEEAGHAPDFSCRISRKRKRVVRRQTNSMQSATVSEGSWEIVKIVGSRQNNNGKEYRVQWKSTWVAEEDIHAGRLLRCFEKQYLS